MIRRLLFFTFLSIFIFDQAHAAVCLPEWKYNRPITVTNSNASPYTDFQVKVIVNTAALIAGGKMKANGDDIRFTDAACNNLHYWIDSNLNTTTTVIWVKVKALGASGNTTINMYYGNLCANAAQNGDSTFLQFDDFIGNSLNTAKWDQYGDSALVSGGRLRLKGNVSLLTKDSLPPTYYSEIKVLGVNNGQHDFLQVNSTYRSYRGAAMFSNGASMTYGANNFNPVGLPLFSCCPGGSIGTTPVVNKYGIWTMSWINTGTLFFRMDATAVTFANALYAQASYIKTGLTQFGAVTNYMLIDWMRTRKYAPVEMGTTVNAENTQGIKITFTPAAVCPGTKLTATFTKSGIFFNSGNSFKLELSDAAGNFGSPVSLGTVNDTIPASMTVDIPYNTAPGNGYKLRLSSTNPAYTCFSPSANLIVYPRPNVSYTVSNDNQCYKYNKYNFTSTSTISAGTIDSFYWNWGDNSSIDSFSIPTAKHSFQPFYLYYYPKLTVKSNLGCKDSFSLQVNIRETPDIKTELSDTIQCLRGNFFTIKSLTTVGSGSIISKSWNFGDASPPVNNVDSLTHVYTSDGIFQVQQINVHSNGCIDTGYIGLLVNTHPVAKIQTNDTDQCLDGNNFIYEATSTITNGLPLLNYWNIGDGITVDLQDSVHHKYPTAGNRIVSLITISDDGVDGCADTVYQTVLLNPMPKANINNVDIEKCFNYNNFRLNTKSTIAYGTMQHNWDFGDLTTTNNKDSVKHSFASDGIYSVTMISISNKACSDTATTVITVRPSPIPSFTITKDTQCFKYNLLKAYSTSSINSGTYTKYWLLSDGSNFTDVDSIKRSFGVAGHFQIKLQLTSNFNCRDTTSDSVYILQMPQSGFSVNDEDQCLEGNVFTFTDNSSFSSGLITGNKWIFDDGTTKSNQSPVNHTYLVDNAYIPGLIVYGDNGCFDTSFYNVKVYPHPGSDFFINDTGQCVNNNNFIFTNNTFIAEGGFTNRWYFGDGSPFVDAFSVTKKYTKDSLYIVKVISISDQGCTDTAWKTITVFPKAKTGFTIDNNQQCVLGNNFNYTSTTTIKKGTFTLNWQHGDGTFAGNVNTSSHKYTNVQSYTVKLISNSNEGCLDTSIKTIKTLPMPVANYTFNYDKRCLKGNDFQFNATTTVSNGTPMNHKWYYGDNDSTINSTFGQHTYLSDGLFTVRLISSTNIGACKDTIDKNFNVFPMPVASLTVDTDPQCFKGNVFGFNSTSTVSSGTIDFNDWNFGDNTTSSQTSPSKSYARVDSFRVSLIVTSNNGCIDSTSKRVHVNPMPVAAFNLSPLTSCLKKNSFKITNKSTIINGVISSYNYQYGNGDSSILASPLPYSYPASGSFVVSLKTTSDKGCWDTISKNITVNPNPIIDFTVDPVCLKDSSIFVNNTIGNITSWKWIFGDGKTSTLQLPKHKYRSIGNFDITLVALTNNNCSDTLFKPGEAIVNPNPKAGFFYTKLRSWENEVDIQYTDTSIGAITWNWNFASMGTSTDQNPKLFYIDTLTQVTTLIVTNNFGCRDTTTKVIFIAPDVVYYMPTAFTPNDDNINETFKPVGLSYAINYKFIIFNRWGQILFKTDNPQIGWDGKFEGEVVQQELYFYRLEFIGVDELRHEEKGNVIILR